MGDPVLLKCHSNSDIHRLRKPEIHRRGLADLYPEHLVWFSCIIHEFGSLVTCGGVEDVAQTGAEQVGVDAGIGVDQYAL